MYKILVVDDEPKIREVIREYAEFSGYEVTEAEDGMSAIGLIKLNDYDIVIMDVMMPNLDGLKATIRIREKNNIPIIILSAKSEDTDKIVGLNFGADDYITKPFVSAEVLARVRSQLRRYAQLGSRPEEDAGTLTIGTVTLDDRTKAVTVDGEAVAVTPTEYAILHLLMANPGKVFSTKALYESVWQEAALGSEGAVAVHIRHLREKIEINPSEPRYLKVVWGQGYKMEGGKP